MIPSHFLTSFMAIHPWKRADREELRDVIVGFVRAVGIGHEQRACGVGAAPDGLPRAEGDLCIARELGTEGDGAKSVVRSSGMAGEGHVPLGGAQRVGDARLDVAPRGVLFRETIGLAAIDHGPRNEDETYDHDDHRHHTRWRRHRPLFSRCGRCRRYFELSHVKSRRLKNNDEAANRNTT
ncbi:MAG: hypothetical protein NVSMB1_14070 [Polyangiales bacterium]